MKDIHIIRRYTDLSSLIDILVNKRLTLLDPMSWDDKNDSYCMSLYKEKNQLSSLLALCFSTSGETYHHWKVFSGSNNGVCILFKYPVLCRILDGQEDVTSDLVIYPLKKEVLIDGISPKNTKFPFVKRYAFKDEKEFRIIRESKTSKEEAYSVEIPIIAIARIVLSPWVNQNLAQSIKKLINIIPECETLEVSKSTLIDSNGWKNFATKLVGY